MVDWKQRQGRTICHPRHATPGRILLLLFIIYLVAQLMKGKDHSLFVDTYEVITHAVLIAYVIQVHCAGVAWMKGQIE